jgi:hypothetical protein
MRRLPLPLVVSLLTVHVVAFAIVAACATSEEHLRWLALMAAIGLGLGATAALGERTWGVGLMLATASALFVAGLIAPEAATADLLGIGRPFFFGVGAVGALPFLLTMKHMARFHRGATVLFALLAGLSGTTASLVWNAAAPTTLDATSVAP